ncbi:geranylgeranyl reductase family protein [candidate division KSB1 bacterium]|nr:geranylgeranyl reductase family protein [candidate division KSB1 bacterium]
MNDYYDIIIVGAGPAGSMAAQYAAREGASVALFERDRRVGSPVRCAEGVSHKSLETLVEIKSSWIAQEITGAVFHSPHGKTVKINTDQIGYVLHREIFDHDLAQMAVAQGAHLYTRANVTGLIKENGKIKGITLDHRGETFDIKCKIIIAADGVESRVGRWAGIKTRTAMKDIETCAQITASPIDVAPTDIHFYFSRDLAPGGYIWIFPKGNRVANVGLGISGEYTEKSPMEYLDQFLTKFPNVSALTTTIGSVPCSLPLEKVVADGFMIVGDAAHHANPMTGGGIINGMIGGKIAGEIAGKSIKENDRSERRLSEYSKTFNKIEGNKLKKFYRIKKVIYKFSDQELNQIADRVLEMPPEKQTLINIFRIALVKKPTLVLDVIKLFTT